MCQFVAGMQKYICLFCCLDSDHVLDDGTASLSDDPPENIIFTNNDKNGKILQHTAYWYFSPV